MRVVRILGMAPNLADMPPTPSGWEVWPSNDPNGYRRRLPRVVDKSEWTRWFNFHCREHMIRAYPSGFNWYLQQTKPIYMQKSWPDIPASVAFPRKQIQAAFATSQGPNRFFSCSVTWLLAFAILEGFERIELWGFRLSDSKRHGNYLYERPAFFYWVQQARNRGIEVTYQPEVEAIPFLPGDPDIYPGTLYGYGTKPEPDWDQCSEDFRT